MDNLVEPKDVAPEVAPTQPEAAPAESSGIPDELLKVPAIQGLLAGSPAAISSSLKAMEKSDVGRSISQNKDVLMQAGMGFYRSLAGDTGVIFNQMYVHPEELKAADKAGKLLQIAPAFSEVNHKIGKMGPGEHPALNARSIPGGFKGAPIPTPPTSAAMIKPQSADAAKKNLTARLLNLQTGAPTSGSNPGQGRLLASIMKPVV